MVRRTRAVSAPSSFYPHPPSLSTPTTASPSVSPTTPTAHPHPNPSSAQNSALAQTTISRLRKLSLPNYAPPLTQNDDDDDKPKGSLHVEGWEYAAPSGIMATRKEVYWPWGTTSHLPPTPEEKEKANDNDAPAAVAAATHSSPALTLHLPPRHRHAPRRSSPPSSSPSGKGKGVFSLQTDISGGGSTRVSLQVPIRTSSPATPDTPSASNSPSPSPSNSPSPLPSSPLPSNSPLPSPLFVPSKSPSPLIQSTSLSQINILAPAPSLDTDSVYQAFVRKWCFAGSARPTASLGPSPDADETAGAPGVGIGVGVVGVRAVTPSMEVSPAPPGDGVYPGTSVGVEGYARERGKGVVGF
ncbi:hypothetical protein L208DRAFT_1398129 [Tricholoma matsutake]|nr:hypothetical protein L208DRAFT_1398129 [Tricholoma matsutake 945]